MSTNKIRREIYEQVFTYYAKTWNIEALLSFFRKYKNVWIVFISFFFFNRTIPQYIYVYKNTTVVYDQIDTLKICVYK